jgi:hypothetical protein
MAAPKRSTLSRQANTSRNDSHQNVQNWPRSFANLNSFSHFGYSSRTGLDTLLKCQGSGVPDVFVKRFVSLVPTGSARAYTVNMYIIAPPCVSVDDMKERVPV